MKHARFGIILASLGLWVAACVAPTPVTPAISTPLAPAETPTTAPEATAAVPAGQPTAVAVPANCPEPTPNTVLQISEANGWCFLYPRDMLLDERGDLADNIMTLEVVKPDPAKLDFPVNLQVINNGPADGLDSDSYAERWLELTLPDAAPDSSIVNIGGVPARVFHDLPGMTPQRAAFIVAHGVKYQITLQPRPEDIPIYAERTTLAWETVTQSISFFTPKNNRLTVRPQDVCPTANAGQKLVVDLLNGYCALLPAGFDIDPDFPQRFIGGPEMGPVQDFGSVRASLAVAPFAIGGQTTANLAPISEQIDPSSVVSATIGGNPAVLYDFTGGPWRQRAAQILVGDSMYSIVAQPWDAAMFPQGIADIETLWQGVTESLAFFTRWR